jgi:hypothetical protein
MSSTEQILAERPATHGRFEDNSRITCDIMQVLQQSPNWKLASPTIKVGTIMIVHKLARAFSGDLNHPDHWLDVAGYASLISDTNQQPTN